jgi:hypothetical protein
MKATDSESQPEEETWATYVAEIQQKIAQRKKRRPQEKRSTSVLSVPKDLDQ